MVKLGKRMGLLRCLERMTSPFSHLLEGIGVATVKKKIMYGMEIKTLLYFRVRGK
jgi:hypothetical protein